jgi:N-acetylglucosamine-6-phosphate deacetylase
MHETGRILTPAGWVAGRIESRDGRIVAIEQGAGPAAAKDRAIVPGFIDLHVHGGFGVDVMDTRQGGPAVLATLAERLPATGTTAFLATTLTAPADVLADILAVALPTAGAACLGFHLEGPMIAPAYRGVQPADAIRPVSPAEAHRWIESGRVRLVTVAPEVPGALPLIRHLTRHGIRVNLGHSGATFAEAAAGFDAGADGVTHLFNAMSPLHHREPGLIGQALDRDGVFVEMIADGHHVVPALVRAIFRLCRERVVLVTDAIRATGLGDGAYTLGPVAVTVAGGVARDERGRLAGSVLTPIEAYRRAVTWGIPPEDVLYALATAPAARLGDGTRGRLVPGARADWVVLTEDGTVVRTVVGGKVVFEREA